MDDPLADLGLETTTTKKPAAAAKAKADVKTSKAAKAGTKDLPAPATQKATQPVQQTQQQEDTRREITEVEVGDIEVGFADFIPTSKRGGGGGAGSKYPFEKLAAPQKKGDKTLYAQFTVKLLEGVDADRLRRSVQSATTNANRSGAAEGKYFVSRTMHKDGEFVGMQVFRTDERPAGE